jgi:hypothetical protein
MKIGRWQDFPEYLIVPVLITTMLISEASRHFARPCRDLSDKTSPGPGTRDSSGLGTVPERQMGEKQHTETPSPVGDTTGNPRPREIGRISG